MRLEDALKGRGVALLIYGLSGSGKTACLRNLPKDETAIITVERQGLRTLLRFGWKDGNIALPRNSTDFYSAIEKAIQEKRKYLCVDTITRYYDLLENEYEAKFGVPREKSDWDRFRYGLALTEKLLEKLMDAVTCGSNLVLLTHEKSTSKEDLHLPDLPGQLPEVICRQMDLILHCEASRTSGGWVYRVDRLSNPSYGKDLFGLDNLPCDNDAFLVLKTCQEKGFPQTAVEEIGAFFAEEPPSQPAGGQAPPHPPDPVPPAPFMTMTLPDGHPMKARFESLVRKCEEKSIATRKVIWGTLELQIKGEDYDKIGEADLMELEKCWGGEDQPVKRRRRINSETKATA